MAACPSCGRESPTDARFCATCGAALALVPLREERKVVTALFADLAGSTARAEQLDPEDVRALLSPFHSRVRAELERFGGTVEKFIGDAIVALFGAPVAREDDPERAVRAAFAIHAAMEELNSATPDLDLRVRIGITTGEALVALSGRASEGEGMASGDVMNIAARLQSAAPVGGILVDELTRRATRDSVEYGEPMEVEAKGKREPVRVWVPVAPRSLHGVDVVQEGVALVGREQELELLARALDRVRNERAPHLVTLVGVPGIGKSRLTYELLKRAGDVVWRQGRCLPYGDGVTFWALGEIVKAHAGIFETDESDQALEKLSRAVETAVGPSDHDWVLAQVGTLVGLRDQAQSTATDQAAAWRRLFEAFAEEQPLVLVVEDLHWADDALLDFIDDFVDWVRDVPILVLCTARPELLDRRPTWGGGKPNASTLSLPPLDADETTSLIAELLEGLSVDAEAQAMALASAGGNPLYAEQYARLLRERPGTATVGVPETVQGLIAARLDSLSSDEKELLHNGAVVGKVFWPGALATMSHLEPDVREHALRALERKEFIRRERGSSIAGQTEHAFRHVLVREVAYGQIPRAARADKHERVARWVESLSESRDDHIEVVAHHYERAVEYADLAGQVPSSLHDRARIALRMAGERALRLGAVRRAAELLARAVSLWPDDRDLPRLLLAYGSAVLSAEGAPAVLEDARARLEAVRDLDAAAKAEALLANFYFGAGDAEGRDRHFLRALELARAAPDTETKADALASISWWAARTGRPDAVELAEEALLLIDHLRLDHLRPNALITLGYIRAPSTVEYEAAIIAAEELGSSQVVGANINLAATRFMAGDLAGAWAAQAAARQQVERFGAMHAARHLESELVIEEYLRGEWDAAEQRASRFLDASETFAHVTEWVCRIVRGQIRIGRGDLAGARDDAVGALGLTAGSGMEVERDAHAFAARVAVAAGVPDQAEAETRAALALWTAVASIPASWDGIQLAFVSVELGATERFMLTVDSGPRNLWIDAARTFASGDAVAAARALDQIGSVPDAMYARLRSSDPAEIAQALAFYRSVQATAYDAEAERRIVLLRPDG